MCLTLSFCYHRSNVLSKKAINTWVHWHALPVLSLCYTPEGTYLLSGGHESVLTKWCHESYGDQSQREYLPRLGAPVSNVTSSADNSVYVTTHLDNCKCQFNSHQGKWFNIHGRKCWHIQCVIYHAKNHLPLLPWEVSPLLATWSCCYSYNGTVHIIHISVPRSKNEPTPTLPIK